MPVPVEVLLCEASGEDAALLDREMEEWASIWRHHGLSKMELPNDAKDWPPSPS